VTTTVLSRQIAMDTAPDLFAAAIVSFVESTS
jgi:hypothetical protein